MAPTKPPMPRKYRCAYHEAGHAILAAQYKIGIQRVALSQEPGRLNRSIFQSAVDFCQLRVGAFVEDDIKLEKYVSFLMGGCAADMLALERYHDYVSRPLIQDRFRDRWCKVIWDRPGIDLDKAYCLMIAWTCALPTDFRRYQLNCWRNTVLNLSFESVWEAVEEVAKRLLTGIILDQAAVVAALE